MEIELLNRLLLISVRNLVRKDSRKLFSDAAVMVGWTAHGRLQTRTKKSSDCMLYLSVHE